jgi:ADP-ribosylglycohydrolase
LEPGQVTDDTAMACLLAAALRGESGETRGEVERAVPLYVRWLNVRPPDVGGQIAKALWQIRDGWNPCRPAGACGCSAVGTRRETDR